MDEFSATANGAFVAKGDFHRAFESTDPKMEPGLTPQSVE
jgi:hypothetical protein